MTGYEPDTTFLQSCGIHLTDDALRNLHTIPTRIETNVPGLFLAGVVCGGLDTHTYFIENSREHATTIMQTIKNRNK
jgi:thioredoxin reductase (NADPH)